MTNEEMLDALRKTFGELTEQYQEARGIMGLAEVAWDFDGEREMLEEATEHMEAVLVTVRNIKL